ncbi:MAG: hypothetical protein JKY56_10275 [Kofleriaceae bacterium]|nr:hypothetical protein [Kofleriaceae bacterium]
MQLGTFLVVASLLVACGATSSIGSLRFKNEAPVLRVNDRIDVATKPPANRFSKMLYHFDGFFHKRLTHASELRRHVRSQNLNSLGEVPDSNWFTNRIGVREMSTEEVGTGPNLEGSPELYKPWSVKSSKVGGVSIGFIIKDSRGVTYLLKFDQKGAPEVETAADVIVAKLLWASGYTIPEDYIVEFNRSDLVLAEGAKVKTLTGKESPLTDAMVDSQLAKIDIQADGSIRGLVSRFAPGVPLGGHQRTGTRPGDINDRVPYENRRDIRGQYAFFSWLDHTDIKEDNTLDMWTEHPNGKDHYVAHYLIDFGKALGAQSFLGNLKAVGHGYVYDFADMGRSLASLGLWQRPWEGRVSPKIRGVGLYESATYDPAEWKPYTPSYFPFRETDRFDNYWGAKVLIRFTQAQIAAVVASARYSDPKASEYMTRTLIERQRMTAKHWFAEVAPLEMLVMKGDSLCFTDLAIAHRLVTAAQRYRVRTFNKSGSKTGEQRLVSTAKGEVCTSPLLRPSNEKSYTIVELTALRGKLKSRPINVHIAVPQSKNAGSDRRIIGIHRR